MSFYQLIVLDTSEFEPFKYLCFTKDIHESIERLEETGFCLKVIYYEKVELSELRHTIAMIMD